LQPGNLHDRTKQALFQRLIPVDWNDYPFPAACHRKNGGYREPEPMSNRAAE
jgi:hypothetical protein